MINGKYIKYPSSMLLQPKKPRIVQVFEMLKAVFEAAPENLPGLVVHTNVSWTNDAWVDDAGNLHMCEADYFRLKNDGLPTIHLQTINDVAFFKIDVGKKIEKLNPDQKRAKDKALLSVLGPGSLRKEDKGG